MASEAGAVRRAIKSLPKHASAIETATIGIASTRFRPVQERLLTEPRPTHIILAGLGGGLDPTLRVGDVVIDSNISNLRVPLLARVGAIHSTSGPICSATDKAALHQQFHAAVVDMEQATVRPVAQSLNIPFIGIRAVSDTANDVIDPIALTWIDDLGRPRLGKLASSLISKPSRLMTLRKLAGQASAALKSLESAVAELIRGL